MVHPPLINNLFANDTATYEGGAITMNQANPIFLNNTIVNSYAGSYGGGLDCVASNPMVINTTFWGNSAGVQGNQVKIWEAYSVPEFFHCNIEGETAGIGGFLSWRTFENNISEDPEFLDPASDWQIANNSPCINAGMPDLSGYNMPGNDLGNNTRIRHNIVDIGAYEVHIETLTATSPITSNTTWIADTVDIESNVVVNDDVTLTIVPGTLVNFKGHYYLKVMGTLIAEGQEDNMIVFSVEDTTGFSNTDTTSGTWNSIVFDNSGSGAGGSMWDNNTSVLSWCRLEYSMTDTIPHRSSGGAIAILYLDQLIIEHCEISNNIALTDGGGIYAKNTKAVIRNNVISNNQAFNDGGGIYAKNTKAVIRNNVISNNQAFNDGGGIYTYYSNARLINNTRYAWLLQTRMMK